MKLSRLLPNSYLNQYTTYFISNNDYYDPVFYIKNYNSTSVLFI